MKLLIITQKMDRNDSVLGFFHSWVLEFSKDFESIIIICLEKGEYTLSKNIEVLSLGKECKKFQILNKLFYTLRFLRYIIRERKAYDTVFVHMNQEYVLLGGIFWRIFGKKVLLWRNHAKGGVPTRVAGALSHKVLYTSPFSYTAQFKNSLQMPAGVDTGIFLKKDTTSKISRSFLFLGRISPVKKAELLLEAAEMLYQDGEHFTVHIYGDAPSSDAPYFVALRKKAEALQKSGIVAFHKGVPHNLTPDVYNMHDVFVNATQTGSMDKTVLEAMACGVPMLVSNRTFEGDIPRECIFAEGDAQSLYRSMKMFLGMSVGEKEKVGDVLRAYSVKRHGLQALAERIKTLASDNI